MTPKEKEVWEKVRNQLIESNGILKLIHNYKLDGGPRDRREVLAEVIERNDIAIASMKEVEDQK